MTQKLVIVGAGGHGKVIADCLRAAGKTITGFVDNDPMRHGERVMGISVLGSDTELENLARDDVYLLNGIGSTGPTDSRRAVFDRLCGMGFIFTDAIHPSAVIAEDVNYGQGIQILANAVINPGCQIGINVVINTRAGIDHDCRLGDHVHIAPGATLSGDVEVGDGAHIGTGASVRNGVTICARATVGVGAAVINDVGAEARVAGVPAKEMLT
tara:strand:- start:7653 stop:8291 length:639 start_codon:yes stop_codon:yes gene_type:complete